MKIKELVEILQSFDQDGIVMMASDPEGNKYSALDTYWDGASDGEKEVGLWELTEEDKANGFTEDDILEEGKRCIVLCPQH